MVSTSLAAELPHGVVAVVEIVRVEETELPSLTWTGEGLKLNVGQLPPEHCSGLPEETMAARLTGPLKWPKLFRLILRLTTPLLAVPPGPRSAVSDNGL